MRAIKSLGRRGAMLFGLAGLAGAVAGVYVSLGLYGKEPAPVANVRGLLRLRGSIDPFAKGEVAAFRPAAARHRSPISLFTIRTAAHDTGRFLRSYGLGQSLGDMVRAVPDRNAGSRQA